MAYFLIHLFVFCLFSLGGFGKDLGIQGHIFPIQEEDLLQFMIRRLQGLSQGDLQQVQRQVENHITKSLIEPRPVENIKEASKRRIYYFDPTLFVNQDILDPLGHVIIKKGTKVNPLEVVSLSQELLFFDGTQAAHLEWAKRSSPLAKWILVKGKPLELEEKEQRPVFFDQYGMLTAKLGIKHVPAKVNQEGLRLKIEEVPARGAYD